MTINMINIIILIEIKKKEEDIYYLVFAFAEAVLFLFFIIESSPKYAPRVSSAAIYGLTFVLLTPSHSCISVGHLFLTTICISLIIVIVPSTIKYILSGISP